MINPLLVELMLQNVPEGNDAEQKCVHLCQQSTTEQDISTRPPHRTDLKASRFAHHLCCFSDEQGWISISELTESLDFNNNALLHLIHGSKKKINALSLSVPRNGTQGEEAIPSLSQMVIAKIT